VGLFASTAFLGAGGTSEQVQAVITGSPEYFRLAGGTDETFLDALYGDALQRAVDPGARAAFLGALARGVPRTAVAAVVFGSDEYRTALVRGAYGEFLRRPPDPAGLAFIVDALRRGFTDQQVMAA